MNQVLFVKGCGAMGSDAIWILFESDSCASVLNHLKEIFKEKSFFILDSDVAWESL